MRYVLVVAMLVCGGLFAAENVAVSVNKETKIATVTITVDVTTIYDTQKTAKDRTLHLLDAVRKFVDRAQKAVAYETAQSIDAEAARAIADQTAQAQAEAAKVKAALPTSNVTDAQK